MTDKRKIEPIEAWAAVGSDGHLLPWTARVAPIDVNLMRRAYPQIVKVRIVPDEPCAWWLDDGDGGRFWANCTDETFGFGDGGPTDNGFRFCPYCGRRIEEG